MNQIVIYNGGISPATVHAAIELKKIGYAFCDIEMIHTATHLLLDTPNAQQNIPANLNSDTVIIGGNLQLPYPCIDLLKDPQYVAQNAMITAHCALKVALRSTNAILPDQKMLIIGWGRIGKCLAQLLRSIGCCVTVAARKESDRSMLIALGYLSTSIEEINTEEFDVIFNTAPELLITHYRSPAIVFDLASKPGITGDHVTVARGLPGKEAPISSGRLIAATVHRLLCRKEQTE